MSLVEPFSDEEIHATVVQMGNLKAPRLNGFQGIFYQSFWDTIKVEVQALMRCFETSEVNPSSLNATHIVLVPKVPNPESISPINLCNYSYKILAKLLANRLRPMLPNLISPMQNAFVRVGKFTIILGLHMKCSISSNLGKPGVIMNWRLNLTCIRLMTVWSGISLML